MLDYQELQNFPAVIFEYHCAVANRGILLTLTVVIVGSANLLPNSSATLLAKHCRTTDECYQNSKFQIANGKRQTT